MSLIPVRCFTCNKIIGNKDILYNQYLESGMTPKDALDKMGVTRICCRRIFLGHVNIIDKLLLFPKQLDKSSESKT
jgi:DNA-directed RNA polymerase I, II, and III subunit RPABC5